MMIIFSVSLKGDVLLLSYVSSMSFNWHLIISLFPMRGFYISIRDKIIWVLDEIKMWQLC